MKRKLLARCYETAVSVLDKHVQPYKHYSFIVQKNKIIGYGMNNNGPAISVLGYPSYSKIHAEVDAYFKNKVFIDSKFEFEVVNMRILQDGRLRNAKPCPCCYGFLSSLNCRRIWFSTDIGLFASVEV